MGMKKSFGLLHILLKLLEYQFAALKQLMRPDGDLYLEKGSCGFRSKLLLSEKTGLSNNDISSVLKSYEVTIMSISGFPGGLTRFCIGRRFCFACHLVK